MKLKMKVREWLNAARGKKHDGMDSESSKA